MNSRSVVLGDVVLRERACFAGDLDVVAVIPSLFSPRSRSRNQDQSSMSTVSDGGYRWVVWYTHELTELALVLAFLAVVLQRN